MVQPLWKTVWQTVQQKKLNIELPYDLAIPFLDVYPKELKARTGTDISMLMSTATLFTVSKT